MEHITKEEYLRLLKKKQVKYRNKKTDTGRGLFASKKEAAFERECFLRLKAGEIKDYAVQVRIPLDVNGVHICFYIADFVIRHNDDTYEIVDTKGVITKDFRIKWKLLKALYSDKYKFTLVK